MIKEILGQIKINESKSDHMFEPKVDNEFDIWNNPGQVMSILRMGPLSIRHTENIVSDRVNTKINLKKMVEKGYISLEKDTYSITQYGRDMLSYISGFTSKKPKNNQ